MIVRSRKARPCLLPLLALLVIGLVSCAPAAPPAPTASKSGSEAAPPAPAKAAAGAGTVASKPTTAAEIAMYRGADRRQLLEEGARKEGTFTLYARENFAKLYSVTIYFLHTLSDPLALPS